MTANAPFSPARLEIRRVFAASRERLFRAWSDPKLLARWFGVSPQHSTPISEVDLRVGGRYRIGMQAPGEPHPQVAGGEYHEIVPPSRLVFTWQWETPNPNEPVMRISLDFHDRDGHTELVLVHERFVSAAQRAAHAQGWEGCLDSLQHAVERGHV